MILAAVMVRWVKTLTMAPGVSGAILTERTQRGYFIFRTCKDFFLPSWEKVGASCDRVLEIPPLGRLLQVGNTVEAVSPRRRRAK